MKKQDCDRCAGKTDTVIMSKFNTQMICNKCKSAEMAHPNYSWASKVELEAVKSGWRDFPGIGLPNDLVGGGHHLLEED